MDAPCCPCEGVGEDPRLLLELPVSLQCFMRNAARVCTAVFRPTDEADIVDEAIDYFRANVLFRSFEMQGAADRVLAYLTLYIQQVRQHAKKCFVCLRCICQFYMLAVPGSCKRDQYSGGWREEASGAGVKAVSAARGYWLSIGGVAVCPSNTN